MMHQFIAMWFGWVRDWHYLGVFLLMAMESSILPVPSEVVIPPAAYWASQGEMSMPGVVIAGTLGSFVGAIIMYGVSRALGRPLMIRYGKFVMVSPDKLEKAERFLDRYETGGVFFARLLPVIRHLIGIPAGIVRMPFGKYCAMTVIGSAVWCTVLAVFGQQVLGDNPKLLDNPEELIGTLKHKSLSIVLAVVVLTIAYIAVVRMTRKPSSAQG
ncbi:MAG TPA: DedA family protein [Polyangiaceae bacterium]|jgi:membrane protein DedA with SNARE-associated domain